MERRNARESRAGRRNQCLEGKKIIKEYEICYELVQYWHLNAGNHEIIGAHGPRCNYASNCAKASKQDRGGEYGERVCRVERVDCARD